MATSRTEYKIFFSSPGGLEEERKAFRQTVLEQNERQALQRGLFFTPKGWEDTRPGVGRPQDLVNSDIADSDILILVLHDRWGSPTGCGGYNSGTIEELARAMDHLSNPKLPMREIVVLFRSVADAQLKDPGPQLRQVLHFREALEDSKELLFTRFDTIAEFRSILRRLLTDWISQHERKWPKTPVKLPVLQTWVETLRQSNHLCELSAEALTFKIDRTKPLQLSGDAKSTPRLSAIAQDLEVSQPLAHHRSFVPSTVWTSRYLLSALLLTTIALSVWIVGLQQTLREVERSQIGISVLDIFPGSTRGVSQVLEISQDSRNVLLIPAIVDIPDFERYSLEVQKDDRILHNWNDIMPHQIDDLNIMLPRSELPEGSLALLLYGATNDGRDLLRRIDFEVRYR